MLQFPSINGGGQTFETYIGMADNASSTNVSNGVYFYVNSSNELRARRIVGGLVGTDTLVTTITAGLWYRLRAEYVAGDTVLSWKQTDRGRMNAERPLKAASPVCACEGPWT